MRIKDRSFPVILTCVLFFCASNVVSAADYVLPDTLWMKVTFYDYHYGPPNPNFGACNCGTARGQVRDTLDFQRKPVLLANVCCNDRVGEWYRPSGALNPVFDWRANRWTSGLVPRPGFTNEWVGSNWNANYDMANVVIYDSLPFTIEDSATGTYRFLRTNKQAFYWLDGRGFGEEPPGSGHNYGFSMELHHEFVYQGGEAFRFAGDDDVWIFINGKLALDLGGMQNAVARTLYLDNEAARLGITVGNKYIIDFFYNERSEPQSDCDIMTNIFTPSKPKFVLITRDSTVPVLPNIPQQFSTLNVAAGDSLSLFAWPVDDSMKVRLEWLSTIVWNVSDSLGNPINQQVFTGGSGDFFFTEAYGTVNIFVTFYDPNFPDVKFQRVVRVYVGPGPADHLSIEGSPDSTLSLRDDNPIEEVSLAVGQTTFDVYAVLRDSYGNWVSHASAAQWASGNTGIVTVAPGNEPLRGEGTITRVGASGQTYVWASQSGMADTVAVVLEGVPYDAIRITGIDIVNDTLRLSPDTRTTLRAEGRRAGTSVWEAIEVRWDSPGLTLYPSAPSWADAWIGFFGTIGDTGTIMIRRTVNNVTIADTVVCIILQRMPSAPPHHIVIEGTINWAASPTQDNPIDTIRIPANVTTTRVYAMLRDEFGTFSDYSRNTEWWCSDTNLVRLTGGIAAVGEGVLTRKATNGTAIITATNNAVTTLVRRIDTAVVVLLGYSYDSLRFVIMTPSGPVAVTELTAQLLQDTTLIAQGRRPDGTWENVQVGWNNSLGLPVSPDAPALASSWTFHFTGSDTGWIEITIGEGAQMLVTRIVVIGQSADLRKHHLIIEADLALAAQAGDNPVDTIKIAKFDTTATAYAIVRDYLGNYVRFSNPTTWVSLKPSVVSVAPARATIGEALITRLVFNTRDTVLLVATDSFDDVGKKSDTVVVVLLNYYYSDYQIWVNGQLVTDSTTIPWGDTVIITLMGLNSETGEWEPVPGQWSAPGLPITSLPPSNSGTWVITPDMFGDPGSGTITVNLPGGITVTIGVTVVRQPTVTSAITRDLDGDGYLDRIDVTLDTLALLPSNAAGLTVRYGNTTFVIDSVVARAGSDSLFSIYLHESTTGDLQTGWRPTLSLNGFGELRDTTGYVVSDGAGPVIRRAQLSLGSTENAPDTLRVYFSESVVWSRIDALPGDVFVYYRGVLVDPSALSGIPASAMAEDSLFALVIIGTDLRADPLIDSLQLAGGIPIIRDRAANVPPDDGRKVPLEVRFSGISNVEMTVGPTPFVPGITQLPAQAQTFYGNVLQGNSHGVIIGVSSTMPLIESTPGTGYFGSLVIYDAVGNVVIERTDAVRQASRQSAYGVFWDGRNDNGRIAGAGVYLAVVTVKDENNKTITERAKVVVARRKF